MNNEDIGGTIELTVDLDEYDEIMCNKCPSPTNIQDVNLGKNAPNPTPTEYDKIIIDLKAQIDDFHGRVKDLEDRVESFKSSKI